MTTVDRVLDLYRTWGRELYDEELPQLDHALQTAAHALAARASDEVVVAALLHDIGHLLHLAGGPAAPHERTGPDHLAALFPPAVTEPVALHVDAKRYLCAVDPDYRSSLSAGSVASLARQGGPMSVDQVRAFRRRPGWEDAVALRRWDDRGKVEGRVVPGLCTYETMMRAVSCSGS